MDIPVDIHSRFLPGIAGTLPIFDELAIRTVSLIQRCLASDNSTIRKIANLMVFSLRMSSPIGRNAFFCCARYNKPLVNINSVDRQSIARFIAHRTDEDTNVCVCIKCYESWTVRS